jgi:hypothetical protein
MDCYPWLEPEDIQACLVYARRLVGHERVDPALGQAQGRRPSERYSKSGSSGNEETTFTGTYFG